MPDVQELQVAAVPAAVHEDNDGPALPVGSAVRQEREDAKPVFPDLRRGFGRDAAEIGHPATGTQAKGNLDQNPASLPSEGKLARWVGLEPTVSDRGGEAETAKGAETKRFSPHITPRNVPLLFQPARRKARSRLGLSNSPLTLNPASLAISIAWGALLAGYVLLALYALRVWVPS